jgi:hypothetical protein
VAGEAEQWDRVWLDFVATGPTAGPSAPSSASAGGSGRDDEVDGSEGLPATKGSLDCGGQRRAAYAQDDTTDEKDGND